MPSRCRASRPSPGFFSKDSILSAALSQGWYGQVLWVAGLIGTFLTGLYAFRLLFIVFWGEPSGFVREHLMTGSHAHAREGHLSHDGHEQHMHAGEGPLSMTLTVGILTVLAAIGGFLQFVGVWTAISNWLDPVAPPLVEASGTQEAVSSVLAVLLGLAGIGVAWLIYAKRRVQAPRYAALQTLLEHKFYFDELYDRVFYRPAVLLATSLYRLVETPLVLGSVNELIRAVRELGLGTGPPPDGARPHVRALDRGQPRGRHRRLPGGQMTSGWLTTALILFPIAGGLVVWLLPLRPFAVGSTALLFALIEVGLWIDSVARFDFGRPGLQLDQQTSWFSDLNVSYHVGFYGFSLWLAGLTVVVLAAAIGYAFWAGRERPRAYFGLMLILTGAIIGVFVAQDLLLFYVFWEAMLIPLYFLVGVWGGAGRLRATLMFVIYTMAGSLLMLASIIVLGLSQGTFDLVNSGTNGSDWIFLGFVAAFAVKAPLFPLHAWLPSAYRESSPEVAAVLSGVVSKAAAYGFLRIAIPKFPGPVSDFRTPILVLAACGLVYGSLLAFRAPDLRGVIAYSSLAQMGLIILGLFAVNDLGLNGAVLQMVNHGLISATLFLLAGGIERRAATGELAALGGMARGRPALATVLMTAGVIALAVPGSAAFAGEFAILAGVFQTGWGYAVVGAVAIVLAAMYMLRLISAVLHQSPGPAVSEAALDLRPAELGVVVPLVALLLVLSAWPAAITERSFSGSASKVVAQVFK